MSSRHRFFLLPFALLASVLQCAQAAPQYVVTPLGNDSTTQLRPAAINNLGQVIGVMRHEQGEELFLSSGGALRSLGWMGTSIPIDINDAGTMLYGDKLHFADGTTRSLPLAAWAINNLGHATGEVENRRPVGPVTYAAIYGGGDALTLTGLADRWNTGWAINDADVAVGAVHGWIVGEPAGSPSFRAARFEGGRTQLLESLGNGYGAAYDINNQGFAVGFTAGHAALWTPEGRLIDLGAMLEAQFGDAAALGSAAYGINNAGEVVGRYGHEGGFLYSDGVMYDLRSLIADPDNLFVDAEGYDMAGGYDINDQHQIITRGIYGWGGLLSLASPPAAQPVPEPASCSLFGAGLLAIGLLKRRRQSGRPTA